MPQSFCLQRLRHFAHLSSATQHFLGEWIAQASRILRYMGCTWVLLPGWHSMHKIADFCQSSSTRRRMFEEIHCVRCQHVLPVLRVCAWSIWPSVLGIFHDFKMYSSVLYRPILRASIPLWMRPRSAKECNAELIFRAESSTNSFVDPLPSPGFQ